MLRVDACHQCAATDEIKTTFRSESGGKGGNLYQFKTVPWSQRSTEKRTKTNCFLQVNISKAPQRDVCVRGTPLAPVKSSLIFTNESVVICALNVTCDV